MTQLVTVNVRRGELRVILILDSVAYDIYGLMYTETFVKSKSTSSEARIPFGRRTRKICKNRQWS